MGIPKSPQLTSAPKSRNWNRGTLLANCACVSGWSCLRNLDLRSKFWLFLSYLGSLILSVYRVAGLVLARKSYVHCEMEVHTVYQRLFKKADKGLHPMQHIHIYFARLS